MNFILVSLPALVVLILCCFTHYGDAIKCYVCNSSPIYDPNGVCANIKPGDTTSVEDCSLLPERDGHPWERCRTIVQDVEGETRIIRSCATHPDKTKDNRCIDRTGTSKIKIRYCECDKDLCNGSGSITPSLFILSLFSLMALVAVCKWEPTWLISPIVGTVFWCLELLWYDY